MLRCSRLRASHTHYPKRLTAKKPYSHANCIHQLVSLPSCLRQVRIHPTPQQLAHNVAGVVIRMHMASTYDPSPHHDDALLCGGTPHRTAHILVLFSHILNGTIQPRSQSSGRSLTTANTRSNPYRSPTCQAILDDRQHLAGSSRADSRQSTRPMKIADKACTPSSIPTIPLQ